MTVMVSTTQSVIFNIQAFGAALEPAVEVSPYHGR